MPYIQIFLIFIVLSGITSCRKDKMPTPEDIAPIGIGGDYCPEMYYERSEAYPDTFYKTNDADMNCVVGSESVYMENYVYNRPILNPNNAFEFAFIRDKPYELISEPELCIYNFCDNTTKILTDKVFYGFDWSVKDWIIFTGEDLQLYKIKSNGDSLTKLTNTGSWNDYARWSPNGTRYLYADASNNSNSITISSESGQILKTFDLLMSSWAWLNENEIIYSNQGNTELRKYNIETETISTIAFETGVGPSGDRITVDDYGNIYTTSDAGLVLANQSGNIEVIDSNYVTYSSGYPQYLTDDKILLQRFINDTTYFEDCEAHYATYISIFDKSTGNERRIKIAE